MKFYQSLSLDKIFQKIFTKSRVLVYLPFIIYPFWWKQLPEKLFLKI